MTQTQNFTIAQSDLVAGGTASYQADLTTGSILYSASIKVGFGWLSKSYKSTGTYQAIPGDLLSASFKTVGTKIVIGNVTFTVLASGTSVATVSMTVAGKNMSGSVLLDVSGEYIKISSAQAVAQVGPLNLTLGLIPA